MNNAQVAKYLLSCIDCSTSLTQMSASNEYHRLSMNKTNTRSLGINNGQCREHQEQKYMYYCPPPLYYPRNF